MARIKRKAVTKKRNDMSEMYELLAEKKFIKKQLEDEIKAIQDKILESDDVRWEVQTEWGTLKFTSTDRWKVTDMVGVFDYIGEEKFLKNCTISKTGIVKAVGEVGLEELEEDGCVKLASKSKYFKLVR